MIDPDAKIMIRAKLNASFIVTSVKEKTVCKKQIRKNEYSLKALQNDSGSTVKNKIRWFLVEVSKSSRNVSLELCSSPRAEYERQIKARVSQPT